MSTAIQCNRLIAAATVATNAINGNNESFAHSLLSSLQKCKRAAVHFQPISFNDSLKLSRFNEIN